MTKWNMRAGHEAALRAMVENAEDIMKCDALQGHRICDLFDAARNRAQEVYLNTVGGRPEAEMTDQARDNALWGARGVIRRWMVGDEADGVSPTGLVADIVRGNEDADPPALRAMVKKAGAINSGVSGSAICDLYQSACAASTEVAVKARRIDSTSDDAPIANPGRSERAACAAIDRWLEEQPEDG